MPSDTQHHRIRGLATFRRLRQDVRSAFSRHPQATLNDSAPVYNALSYVWGVDPPKVTIICNGQRLKIRPELSFALVRLRLKHTARIIWADALCINQVDNQEKSHQVPLMGKIFSRATEVNVWLGRGEKNVIKSAIECSKLIANACREFSLAHNLDLDEDETLAAVEIPITVFTVTVCGGLEELFTRPLFTRVWCVQEVLLARDALVIWGEHELPWKDVGLTASWIVSKWAACEGDGELGSLLTTIDVGDVYDMYDFDHFGASLLETLSDFRRFQSTDPKDKVYGLISLVSNEPDIGSIIPDYEKSVADVYAETALHILTVTQQLPVFGQISHDADYDGEDGYRSWAPRWDCSFNTTTIGSKFGVSGIGACSRRETQNIAAKHIEGGQLYLTGIIYAAVTIVDSTFDMKALIQPEGLRRHRLLAKTCEEIDWDDPEKDTTLHNLARTLTAGYSTDDDSLKTLDNKSLSAHYERFRNFFEWWQTSQTADWNDVRGDAQRYRSTLIIRCQNRRFFLISKYNYGIGPACMREGDIVVVLYGGDAPFVLRPKSDKYLMLGEAYVDSIMNGELVKEVEEGKLQEQEFCLI
ncbi:heterokaryon incompatibility protein-domain-containing protein [Alternaria rosae]|uniref:heterokaryon incompatibility protein-domain-containing protein n=1 Tax=Alternaria rosae TaxID=1187941 RepID=UPI001E8E66D8|nr:heterokaryon incompatibility protein-domain-containing protein [Alternaria rosae]KAH6878060.1 heterokaryon incompatibility protein-domain-containing protein [Alternaria rosae]